MEEGFYICSWSRSAAGFELWVKARPYVRAAAPTYEEAEMALIAAIQQHGGAMHAMVEFDPPLPRSLSEEKYSRPDVLLIGGGERFETDAPRRKYSETASELDERLRTLDAYYDRPACRKCKFATGRRNERLPTLTYAGKYDGAFGSFATDGGPTHQIVSEDFLALLTPEEASRLEFQPTIRKRGRKFFELVGPEGPPFIAVAGLPISGWRCAACDHCVWGYWIPGLPIESFIAAADIGNSPSGVFTVGTFPEIHLAVTEARWQELVGKRGTRGFTSSRLGVVRDDEVIRSPQLPTYDERLAERQRCGRTT